MSAPGHADLVGASATDNGPVQDQKVGRLSGGMRTLFCSAVRARRYAAYVKTTSRIDANPSLSDPNLVRRISVADDFLYRPLNVRG